MALRNPPIHPRGALRNIWAISGQRSGADAGRVADDWLSSLPVYAVGIVIFALMAAAAAGGFCPALARPQTRTSRQESGNLVAQEGYLLTACWDCSDC